MCSWRPLYQFQRSNGKRLIKMVNLSFSNNIFCWNCCYFIVCQCTRNINFCLWEFKNLNLNFLVRKELYDDLKFNSELQYIYWAGSSIILGLVATGLCALMGGKASQGSGVPELKTIISGVNDYTYLRFRYLVGKLMALPLVLAASKGKIFV